MPLATLEIANELRPSPRDLGLPEARSERNGTKVIFGSVGLLTFTTKLIRYIEYYSAA